jgi:hypothetical protein
MSSESKKGTQIYCPFLSETPNKRIPSRLPNRAPMEIPAYRAFYISRDISLYLRGLKRRASLHVLHKWGPMETDTHSRALFNIYFWFPSKGALPPGPPHVVPLEGESSFLEPSFIHHSKFPVYESPS